ncbi:MAG: amino acid ABC transporter substrate-binding protein [Thermomicrobiales bacterium]|nr:amino acid ABC transporter substrate-binding protein [Thermomicrobiales bacterium]
MTTRRKLFQISGGALAAAMIGSKVGAQVGTPGATPQVEIGDISVLPLKEPGKFIVHTDEPAYEPWVFDDDPSNGKGFESALIYAIADRLGFEKEQVEWGRTSFNASFAPGPKPFDAYLAQVSITPERARAVGFSIPYVKGQLAVIANEGSPVLEAETLADLAKFKWGTQVGTIYYSYIEEFIKPEQDILVFDTNVDSLTALDNGTVDAGIQDLQIAFYVTEVQFPTMEIAGALPAKGSGGGSGLVTDKESELIPYLNSAIVALQNDGTLQGLFDEYLAPPADMKTFAE